MQARALLMVTLALAVGLAGCVENVDGLRKTLAGGGDGETPDPALNGTGDVGGGNATGDGNETEPLTPPVARMRAFDHGGIKLFESDFVAADGSAAGAAVVGKEVTFQADDSEAVERGAQIVAYRWDFDDGSVASGTSVRHAFPSGGVYEVTLTVTDNYGNSDALNVSVPVVYDAFPSIFYTEGAEEGTEWTPAKREADPATQTLPSLAEWRPREAEGAPEGARAWYVGLPADLDAYPSDAEAWVTSPPVALSSDYVWAGWGVRVSGGSEAGYDFLQVQLRSAADEAGLEEAKWSTLLTTSGQQASWALHEDLYGLTEHIGKTVQFRFLFTSDGGVEEGPGWFVDDFHLGGSTTPLHGTDAPVTDGHGHSH